MKLNKYLKMIQEQDKIGEPTSPITDPEGEDRDEVYEAIQTDPTKKGFFDKCVKKMRGKVDDPDAYCAGIKDRAFKSTYWRGKGKSPAEVKKDVKLHSNH